MASSTYRKATTVVYPLEAAPKEGKMTSFPLLVGVYAYCKVGSLRSLQCLQWWCSKLHCPLLESGVDCSENSTRQRIATLTNHDDLPRTEGSSQDVRCSVLKPGKFWANWDELAILHPTPPFTWMSPARISQLCQRDTLWKKMLNDPSRRMYY